MMPTSLPSIMQGLFHKHLLHVGSCMWDLLLWDHAAGRDTVFRLHKAVLPAIISSGALTTLS